MFSTADNATGYMTFNSTLDTWYLAQTLQERLEELRRFQNATKYYDANLAHKRLAEWKKIPAFSEDIYFKKMLEANQCSEEELLQILGVPPERLYSKTYIPDWLISFLECDINVFWVYTRKSCININLFIILSHTIKVPDDTLFAIEFATLGKVDMGCRMRDVGATAPSPRPSPIGWERENRWTVVWCWEAQNRFKLASFHRIPPMCVVLLWR